MKREKIALMIVVFCFFAEVLAEKRPVLRSGINPIACIEDGKAVKGGRFFSTEADFEEWRTTAREVVFASDVDTLKIVLEEWQSQDFDILTAAGDTARVRVTRTAANPFENPDPQFKTVSPSGMLSREQAGFDIKALVYSLGEIHPDLFSVCSQTDFFRAVHSAIASLPDSVGPMDLYRIAAPLVAMIGDGHTCLRFPYNSVFTAELKRMPMFVEVLTDRSLLCRSSLDSLVPRGARILTINGTTADRMIEAMLPYESGERLHFRMSRVNADFTALFQMLFPAESYEITFVSQGEKRPQTVVLPAVRWDDMVKRCPPSTTKGRFDDYSFTVDSVADVAVMDFRSFRNPGRMETFADSLFTTLRKQKIDNLVIDLRENGGGDSSVGDILLRYISPEPFVQMDRALIRVSPLTSKLTGLKPRFDFDEDSPDKYLQPRTAAEGHYHGHVYLLTSNHTFSSAGSFAWTFKEVGAGTVVGEETGGMNVSYGDILAYRLPISDLLCTVSYKRFWQFRADENDIHGAMPDISVPSAEAMQVAMKLVRKNKRSKR